MLNWTWLKSKISYILLYSILLGTLVGCGTKDVATTPNVQPPSIMVDDVLYYSTGKALTIEVDEATYIGNISSVVSISELPAENGQANIPFKDAPYAKYLDGIIVLMDEEWIIFEVRDDG